MASHHYHGSIDEMSNNDEYLNWYRVADVDELPDGRVKTVTADTHSMALTDIDGKY